MRFWIPTIVTTTVATVFHTTNGFVYPSNQRSMMTTTSSSLSFVRRPFCCSRSASSSSSSSALCMNLFDRFSRVAKANVNNILKNLEDPEKIMNQALEDMQGDLVKVRQSYAEITATQRRLLKQKEQAEALAEDWYKRAQLALQKSNDSLAREALTRRQQQLDIVSDLQTQIDSQVEAMDKLYEGMQSLESRILESKAKKDQLAARARTAQSTQKVNDMLGGITGKTSMDAFSRMEEKVEALEAAAEVSAEMGSVTGNALPGSAESTIEKEFRMLEGSSAVDDELQRMKGLLTGSTDASSSSSSSSSVDDELDQLKRDAGL